MNIDKFKPAIVHTIYIASTPGKVWQALTSVARVERSATRGPKAVTPDYAALHPGYDDWRPARRWSSRWSRRSECWRR